MPRSVAGARWLGRPLGADVSANCVSALRPKRLSTAGLTAVGLAGACLVLPGTSVACSSERVGIVLCLLGIYFWKIFYG